MGVSNDGDLMFQVECNEPEGRVVRSVYKVVFTPENIEKIYQKAKQFRTIMGWEIPTYESFIAYFLTPGPTGAFDARGLCARIDDYVGIFWLADINYTHAPFCASIHYTFFDRRHRGRLNLCRQAIKYTFDTYNFERLSTMVPLYMKSKSDHNGSQKDPRWTVMDFVERIGFEKEGRLKDKMLYKGTLYDANLYGLTKSNYEESFRLADQKYKGSEQKWGQATLTTASK